MFIYIYIYIYICGGINTFECMYIHIYMYMYLATPQHWEGRMQGQFFDGFELRFFLLLDWLSKQG